MNKNDTNAILHQIIIGSVITDVRVRQEGGFINHRQPDKDIIGNSIASWKKKTQISGCVVQKEDVARPVTVFLLAVGHWLLCD